MPGAWRTNDRTRQHPLIPAAPWRGAAPHGRRSLPQSVQTVCRQPAARYPGAHIAEHSGSAPAGTENPTSCDSRPRPTHQPVRRARSRSVRRSNSHVVRSRILAGRTSRRPHTGDTAVGIWTRAGCSRFVVRIGVITAIDVRYRRTPGGARGRRTRHSLQGRRSVALAPKAGRSVTAHRHQPSRGCELHLSVRALRSRLP